MCYAVLPHLLPQREPIAVYMLPQVLFKMYKKCTVKTARKNKDVSLTFVTTADNNNTSWCPFIPAGCIVLLSSDLQWKLC